MAVEPTMVKVPETGEVWPLSFCLPQPVKVTIKKIKRPVKNINKYFLPLRKTNPPFFHYKTR
jgi:hypothetical protein